MQGDERWHINIPTHVATGQYKSYRQMPATAPAKHQRLAVAIQ